MKRSIRVLHVDDDPRFAEMVSTFLEREEDRIDVRTATSATEALELLAERGIDCLVSDFDMPGQDGIELLKTVREREPELPFILYTGKGSEEVAGEAISAGVTDYLQKQAGSEQYAILANRIVNAVEQYRSQREIERSEKRLREVVDALPHVLYVVDEDGTYLLANEALAEFHHTTVEELEESHVGEILADTVVERFRDDVETALEAGELVTYPDVEVEDGTGATRVLEPRLVPFEYGDSDVDAVLGFSPDVTEWRRQREELRRAREEYRELFDGMNDTAWVISTDGEFRAVNEAAVETLGYSREKLLSMRPHDIDEGLDPEEITALIENMPADETQVFETAHRTKSGTTIPVEISSSLITYRGETAILSIARDISERKERERKLGETTERLELALKAADLGVFEWDVKNDAISFDDRVAELLGFAPDEFDADLDSWVDRTHPDDLAAVEENIESLFEGEQDVTGSEYRVRSKGGNWVWIRSMGAIVKRTNAGDPELVIGVHQDVTERKKREQALERERDRLDEFVSIVSHDLRNPLNVAQGRLQLAREECDSEHLGPVDRAHDRMCTLIEDLLTLAREGETVTEYEPVSLAALVEECWTNVATADATLVVDIDRQIRADRSRLKQVFENLFRNAVEHGGEDVTVTIGPIENGFYVADDGPGISEGDRESVFEPGYSTSQDGTGFGLSIVDQIVRAHRWEIEVIDSSDDGTRFEVTGTESANRSE